MALSAATISTHSQLQAALDLSREAGLLTPELQRKLQTEIYTRACTHTSSVWDDIPYSLCPMQSEYGTLVPPPQPSIPVMLDRLMIKPKLLTPGLGSTWMSQAWHRISELWPDSAMAWMSLRQTLYLPEIPPHYLHCPFLYTQLPYHHRMESTESMCTLCYIALRSQPVQLSRPIRTHGTTAAQLYSTTSRKSYVPVALLPLAHARAAHGGSRQVFIKTNRNSCNTLDLKSSHTSPDSRRDTPSLPLDPKETQKDWPQGSFFSTPSSYQEYCPVDGPTRHHESWVRPKKIGKPG